ncbi:uncharacterized protein LOC125224976 [Leguminivora glycinivorella]|uniref:uncharacterized protein LOC125224976 n=1 Tax=Leguminivora glycinivorella TaxID=1035111 RepID=UPI00200F606C|nr:uncharacterized protein LOC125224976 [Leguminivora glycinivorella]
MKKGKTSQATLKSKSHSSVFQIKDDIVLPPLDELIIRIRNLRLTGLERVPHIVTVTFFDQLLISEPIMPIGAREIEEEEPYVCGDIRRHTLLRTSNSRCETHMNISKRMEPMNEPTVLQMKSWDNLPLIKMELQMVRHPDNKFHHQTLDAANIMKMTVVAACNIINPYDKYAEYIAASKIRISQEDPSGIETFKQSISYPKRFSVNNFYPKWASISWDDSFRKCEEKVSYSMDDLQNNENIDINHYLSKKQSNSVVWGSFHRSLVLSDDVLSKYLRRYYWPMEFHMISEEGGYSFMGLLDLSKLLYPGETAARLVVPLLWLNSFVMMDKCGCEPLLNANEKTPRSTAASAGQTIKETAPTSGSAVTDDSVPQPPPTGSDDGPAFMIVEVTLARPLLKPTIPPPIPESEIDKMITEKTEEMLTCTGRGQQNTEWRDTVASGAEVLRRLPHYGLTEFCSYNRQLSKTRTRIELTTSFWQEAAVYVNNNFVVQDFVDSDNTFEEMVMMAHSCLVREASNTLLGSETEQEHTLRAARHARQMQDVQHATELYLQLVTKNQNNPDSWRELATCLMDEDVDLARVCINEALLLNPRHPLTLLSKGSMLYEEDPESAELFFTAILSLYPFWTSGWVIAKAFYIERQEFVVADKIQKCVNETRAEKLTEDLAPERGWEKELGDWWYSTPLLPSTNQYLEAADLLLRLRAMSLAEMCLARALSSQGPNPTYSHLVALACRLRGDVDNALCLLKEGFGSFGEINYLHSLNAECLTKKDDHNAALTSYEKAGNCVNTYSILIALPGRDPQRARSVLVDLLRRQPSAYAWMALADDWLMRQVAAGKLTGAGDADAEVAMSTCAAACAEQALRWDRRFARAWALLAQLANPKARRAHCKAMASTYGYKWTDENCELSGAQKSLCHLLGTALKECRCNLCEITNKTDCAHTECECVKSILH